MAGDSSLPGLIFRRKDENGKPKGYSFIALAEMLDINIAIFRDGIRRMIAKEKISVDKDGVISILNWDKYQSEYQRQKPYREGYKNRSNQSNALEGELSSPSTSSSSSILFSFSSLKWEGITKEKKEVWAAAYPACDIDLCLSQMAAWLEANPKKVKKNYRQFIVNWLSKEQQRGGMTKKGREVGNRPAGNMLPEFMKDAAAEHDRLKKAGKI